MQNVTDVVIESPFVTYFVLDFKSFQLSDVNRIVKDVSIGRYLIGVTTSLKKAAY